jgi:hypothetical protein
MVCPAAQALFDSYAKAAMKNFEATKGTRKRLAIAKEKVPPLAEAAPQ